MREELERNSIEYEISLSSFKQQVAYKQKLLLKLSEDMSIKISNNEYKKKQATSQMVQLCRKNIQEIQHIFLDLHSYFIDLKLAFVYDIAVEIFKTLVLGYKLLSQRFVALLKNKRKKDDGQTDGNFHRNTEKLIQEAKQKNLTQIQYYDCLIKTIQLDEYRLAEKSREAEKKIFIDKALIENVNASDAVHHLEALKRQMDRIIMYSVKLANDSTNTRESENKKNLKEITNPDQIQNEYCTSIAVHTQQVFTDSMNSIAKKFYEATKQRYRQEFIKQAIKNKPLQIHRDTQTYDLQFKQRQQHQKLTEMEGLKKMNAGLTKDLKQINQKIIKLEEQKEDLQSKVKYTIDMLNRKSLELHKAKGDFESQLKKKDELILTLNKKVTQIESTNGKVDEDRKGKDQSVVSPQKNFEDNQESLLETLTQGKHDDDDLSVKLKFNANKSHHTSFFYEKEFKATKQQNSHLRKSLSIMLDALKEQKLILEYPINDLNNDLRLGKLISKIQAISIQLLNKVRQIRLRDQTKIDDGNNRSSRKRTFIKSQLSIIQTDRRKQAEKKFAVAETQTAEAYQVQSIYANENKTTRGHTTGPEIKKAEHEPTDKLQTLKKQLMKKVYMGKRAHSTVRISRRKQSENLGLVQKNNNSNKASNSNLTTVDESSNSKRVSKLKPSFNRKDVSFEQFKFSIMENKSQYAEKKIPFSTKKSINTNFKMILPKDKRRNNNKSHDIRHLYEEESQCQEEVLGAQTNSCLNEVKKMIQTIEGKKEKKEIYLRIFINKLVEEVGKIRGSQVVDELFMMQSTPDQKQNHSSTLCCK